MFIGLGASQGNCAILGKLVKMKGRDFRCSLEVSENGGSRIGEEATRMSNLKTVRIQDHFQELRDPRRREVTYPLINVVVIAICAVICGADDFVAIAQFGNTKRDWFAKFLDLSSGIPSHDRFNAIFAALNPAEFEKCLLSWITMLHEITDG